MKLKIGFCILLLFAFSISNGQKHFTITYQEGGYQPSLSDKIILGGAAFDLVIQDTIAICYYTTTPHGDSILVKWPLESSFKSKFSFINNKVVIYPKFEKGKKKKLVLVERDHEKIYWEYFDDVKMILGYKCKRAEGIMNNMKYEVWYSEDLPASFGPFMWTGLPGTTLLALNFTIGSFTGATSIKNEALPIVEPNFAKRVKE